MMAAMPLEMIQARNLTSRLRTASFLVDREGTLVYFNGAAAELLGMSFEEAGPMKPGTWGTRFRPREPGGRELRVEELPLAIAVQFGRAGFARMQITGADGDDRDIEVTALPIMGGVE
jgi:PAS domain-containing protein